MTRNLAHSSESPDSPSATVPSASNVWPEHRGNGMPAIPWNGKIEAARETFGNAMANDKNGTLGWR